jgi:hypothetical protein
MRKDMDLELEERVSINIDLDEVGRDRLNRHLDHLKEEVRADTVSFGTDGTAGEGAVERTWDIDGDQVVIGLLRTG